MSKSTISTFQLFELFPDQESARLYLEAQLWPDGPHCPVCGLGEHITARKNGYYRCNQCKETFTIRTDTIFERSHVPLHKWLYAMYLLVTSRKGISSLQLSKQIGVTQKTAWFILHRLREANKHRAYPMMEIYDFGIRSVPPCGDCDERGHCTMNCGPASMKTALDATASQVLSYKPKPKSEAAKKRKRKAKKASK